MSMEAWISTLKNLVISLFCSRISRYAINFLLHSSYIHVCTCDCAATPSRHTWGAVFVAVSEFHPRMETQHGSSVTLSLVVFVRCITEVFFRNLFIRSVSAEKCMFRCRYWCSLIITRHSCGITDWIAVRLFLQLFVCVILCEWLTSLQDVRCALSSRF